MMGYKKCVMLLLVFCVLLSDTMIRAEDAAAPVADEATKKAKVEKTSRRKEAAERRKQLESCLVLIRAYYSRRPETFDKFLKEHPTNDKTNL